MGVRFWRGIIFVEFKVWGWRVKEYFEVGKEGSVFI